MGGIFDLAVCAQRPALQEVPVHVKSDKGQCRFDAVNQTLGLSLLAGAVRVVGNEGQRIEIPVKVKPEYVFGGIVRNDQLGNAVSGICYRISGDFIGSGEFLADVCVILFYLGSFRIAVQRFILQEHMDIILGLISCNQRHIRASHNGIRAQLLSGKKPHTEPVVLLGGRQRCEPVGKLFTRLQLQLGGGKRSAVWIQRQGIQLVPLRINRQIRVRLDLGDCVSAEILLQIPTGKGIPAPGGGRKRVGLVLFNLFNSCLAAVVGNQRQLDLLPRRRIVRVFPARHRHRSNGKSQNAQQQKNTKLFHGTPLCFLRKAFVCTFDLSCVYGRKIRIRCQTAPPGSFVIPPGPRPQSEAFPPAFRKSARL